MAASTAALSLGGVAPATAHADAFVPTPSSTVFTLVGRGWGHGRGMSQYGAYAAGSNGQSWQQIIGFYYPGTTVAKRAGSTIRVSVAGHVGSTARVAAEPNLVATDGAGQTVTLPTIDATGQAVASWEFALPTSGTTTTVTIWERTVNGARVAYRSTTSGSWRVTPGDGSMRLLTSSGYSAGSFLGTLRATRSGTQMVPVVETTLEDYTRQVVPNESPGSWPVQTLAAQAVAARSYGAWYQAHPRSSWYDICDTTACQVFGGIGNETSNSLAGVRQSAGTVITLNGAAVRAEFSSSNGGAMAAGDASFQVAKVDPNERTLPASVNQWSASISAASLQAAYPSVGTVTGLTVAGRTGIGPLGGRVSVVTITGTSGTRSLTGNSFASAFGLKSSLFAVAPTAASVLRDVTGDGQGDLLSIDGGGRLLVQAGIGGGQFASPSAWGTSWGGFSAVVQAGRFNADSVADVIAVTKAGTVLLYPSNGYGLRAAITIGTGLTGYDHWVALKGFNGSNSSLLARRTRDGALVRFDASSGGWLASPVVISPSGWAGNAYTAMLGSGDITGDGRPDLVVRTASGLLQAWQGTGSGRLGSVTTIGTGWGGFRDLVSPGDVTGDGLVDVIARDAQGFTRLYAGRAAFLGRGLAVGTSSTRLVP